MQEFHERFRLNKTQAQADRGIPTSSDSPTVPVVDDVTPSPKKSTPIKNILLTFSLIFNVMFIVAFKDVITMYASPEHTLWKARTNEKHYISESFITTAKREVCK